MRFYRFFGVALALLSSALVFSACEPKFAGERAENAEIVNGPFQMKIKTINGTEYLVVLNTNYRFQAANGSLHFYSLVNPVSPVKATINSLSVPSNASDFEVIDGATPSIYLLNRNSNELWIYDLQGTAFQRRLDARGGELAVKTPDNSMSILSFNRQFDNALVFAITSQRSGTTALLLKDTLTYVNPADIGITKSDSLKLVGSDIFGARYYMEARQTQTSGQDDEIRISSSQQLGIGIIQSKYLGDTEDTIVSINGIQNALYSFQFKSFLNTSNFTWDLYHWRETTTLDNGSERKGSGENGFRGLDIDVNKNVYVANRADNSLYKIPAAQISLSKTGDRNTTGFAEDVRTYRVPIDFDSDVRDDVLPKLGSLVVDQDPGPDAAFAWVLGLKEGVVYRADLNANTFIQQKVGDLPQRILGRPTNAAFQQIYVANTKSDSIQILDATTLNVLGEIKNP